VEAGWLSSGVFFQEDFQEFKTPFDADEKSTQVLNEWFHAHRGVQQHYLEDVPTAQAILEKVGDHHAAHLDLAGAHFRAGELDEAERHVRRALELGYPVPGLAYNYLAVIEFQRGNIQGMQDHFMTAAKTDPQHDVLIQNVERARAWFKELGPERGVILDLHARHDFQLLERTLQPTLPGPLQEDYDDWNATPRPIPRDLPGSHEVTPERYGKQGFPERRLKVLV
jgi:tetratricopeptide (TPR) repeat protein